MTLEGFDQTLKSYSQLPDDSPTLVGIKSFFTFAGGPGNKPTCGGQTLQSIGNDLIGGAQLGLPAGETALKAAAMKQAARAAKYAAGRTNSLGGVGLLCNGCSSVFRRMMLKSEVAEFLGEAAVPVEVSMAAVTSGIEAGEQARSGECAALFPIF